jgi:hypothetical protein
MATNVNLRGNATGTPLGATSTPLQIKIYSKTAASVPENPSAATGVISFDDNTQRVGINGIWYGTSNTEFTTISEQVTAMLEALDKNGMVKEEVKEGKTTYTTTDVIGVDNNGVITIAGTNITGTNVADVIAGVKGAIETTISNMQKTATGGATSDGKHVEVTVALGATGPKVTVSENDIASATGLAAVKATADSAVQSVNTKTGTAITLNGADINVGPTGDTGAYGQSSIQVAIQDLADKYAHIDKDSFVHSGSLVYGPADNIEGKHNSRPADVTGTKSETANDPYIELVIKEHQLDEAQETVEAYVYIKATSLVDIYDGTTGTVTGVTGADSASSTQITVSGTSISAAVTIKNATETGTVTGSVTGTATGIEDYVQVANSISVTTEAGTVTDASVGTGVSVDKAGAAKKAYDTAKTELIGTTGDATALNTIHAAKNAAAAAQTAADTAAAEAAKHTTVTGSTGTASNKDYIVVTDTRANNTDAHAYTVKTTEALDTAISTAEQNAKNYADTIISWEVI